METLPEANFDVGSRAEGRVSFFCSASATAPCVSGIRIYKTRQKRKWIPDDSTGTQMSLHHLADHRPPEEQRIILEQLSKGELCDALHAILCGDCHNLQALGIFWSHVWQPLSRLWDVSHPNIFIARLRE